MDKPRNEKDSANANEPSVYVIDLSASSSNQVPVDKTQHENGSTSANRPSVHVIDFSASSSSQIEPQYSIVNGTVRRAFDGPLPLVAEAETLKLSNTMQTDSGSNLNAPQFQPFNGHKTAGTQPPVNNPVVELPLAEVFRPWEHVKSTMAANTLNDGVRTGMSRPSSGGGNRRPYSIGDQGGPYSFGDQGGPYSISGQGKYNGSGSDQGKYNGRSNGQGMYNGNGTNGSGSGRPNICGPSCNVCRAPFTRSIDAAIHELSHSNPMYECDICQEHFDRDSYMKLHVLQKHMHHGQLACSNCLTPFNRFCDLVAHTQNIVCWPRNRPMLACVICHRRYTDPKQLDNHLKEHASAQPYSCLTCYARFANRADLMHHLSMA